MRGFAASSIIPMIFIAGCVRGPVAPSGSGPTAVIAILGADATAPLAIHQFTPLVFSSAHSTGDGLSYAWDFGDGTGSTSAIAAHVSSGHRVTIATLSVTDRFGRTASTTQPYFVGKVENRVGFPEWWQVLLGSGRSISLDRVQRQGDTLSGLYSEQSPGLRFSQGFTGTLSGLRTITIRTTDGSRELTGTMEWNDGPVDIYTHSPVLRLTAQGGIAHGVTLRFALDDPY